MAVRQEYGITPILANREGWEDYWDIAYANVEAAYEHGLLSGEQWELIEAIYADIDRENGQIYDLPEAYDILIVARCPSAIQAGHPSVWGNARLFLTT